MNPSKSRALLVATAAAATFAVGAPAAQAYISINIYDGVGAGAWQHDGVSAWSSGAPTTLEVVRGGAVISQGSDSYVGFSSVDLAAGDVIRVRDAQTQALIAETTYSGKPAVVACPGGATFTGTSEGGQVHVSASPDETTVRYSDADFGFVESEVTSTGAAFAGTWSRALPANAIVQAFESRGSTDWQDPAAVNVTTLVARRVADLCPAQPATPAVTRPAATPASPVAPAKPVALTPKLLTQQLLTRTIQGLAKGGIAGVTKTHDLPVAVVGAGTVQIQQFSGSAPKKVAAYAAAAKKKAKPAAAPRNLLASGSKTFAKAGSGTVKVKPSKRAKALVKGKRTLAVTVRVVFTPKGGKPVATDKKITLKRGK